LAGPLLLSLFLLVYFLLLPGGKTGCQVPPNIIVNLMAGLLVDIINRQLAVLLDKGNQGLAGSPVVAVIIGKLGSGYPGSVERVANGFSFLAFLLTIITKDTANAANQDPVVDSGLKGALPAPGLPGLCQIQN